MSIIHINQLKSKLHQLFDGKIDLTDVKSDCNNLDNFFLTRSLTAYVVHYLANADVKESASAVTDGGDDNGIDGIYYDEKEKQLLIIQSKWIHSGKGEPDNGEIKKYISGVMDLFNLRFEKFNNKINIKKDLVKRVLDDPYSRYKIVVAYTGNSSLALHSTRDLEELRSELNDTSDLIDVVLLNQQKLHASLTIGLLGDPIVVDLSLRSWGKISTPHLGYYGQIDANQIADIWKQFRNRLFARNLRNILGDTDVNNEIRSTLKYVPENFWYFNNGITVVAKKICKTMAYGADTDYGTFHCEDISIVNGAQTVGTIGKFSENSIAGLDNVYIPVRVISLENAPQTFGEDVTRTNNRQNRIENRDFVALDPEQARIKQELAIDGITYNISRGENTLSNDKSFDLIESTTALACASGRANLVVLVKKELNKLWEDINKPPYKELFNKSVSGMYIWRCVRTLRMIESSLGFIQRKSHLNHKNDGILFYGNRIITSMVFVRLGRKNLDNLIFDFELNVNHDTISKYVEESYTILNKVLNQLYPNPIFQTIFKNTTKCTELLEICCTETIDSAPFGQGTLFE